MGSLSSKFKQDKSFSYATINANGHDSPNGSFISTETMETPISKFKSQQFRFSDLNTEDPRSPSQFIMRTPISFTSNTTPQPTFETDVKTTLTKDITPILKNLELDPIDPRSPSTNVDRTPFFFDNNIDDAIANDNQSNAVVSSAPNTNILSTQKFIFEDNVEYLITPKKINDKPTSQNNRTPLSCLGNNKNQSNALLKKATSNRNQSKNKENIYK